MPTNSNEKKAALRKPQFEFRSKVFCILGDENVFWLKSPAIFSPILKHSGIKGEYVPFMVKPEHIGQAMQGLRIFNIAGANVTAPYKEKVVSHLDVLSEGANIIGAVNTIVRNGDELKGYNTSAIGFMDALSDVGFDVQGKSALVIGTKGVAKAVVFILNWLRAGTIYVAGRNHERTRQIVNRFGGEALLIHTLSNQKLPVDIIINATSVSSTDESPELAVFVENLDAPNCEMIVDLNYGRTENFWQSTAENRGTKFMDGLSQLAFQARRTFALWTGMQIPPEEFLKAVSEA